MVFLLTASLLATASQGATPPTVLPPYLAGLPTYDFTDDKRPKICAEGIQYYSGECYPPSLSAVPTQPFNTDCMKTSTQIIGFGYFVDDVVVSSFPNTPDESQQAYFTKKKDLTNNWEPVFNTGIRRDAAYYEKLYPFLGNDTGNLLKEQKAFAGIMFDQNASVTHRSLYAAYNHAYDNEPGIRVTFTEMVQDGEHIGNTLNPNSPNYDPNSRRLADEKTKQTKPRIPGSVDTATGNVIRDGFKRYSVNPSRTDQPEGMESTIEEIISGRRKLQESKYSSWRDEWNAIIDTEPSEILKPYFNYGVTVPYMRSINPEDMYRVILDFNIRNQNKFKCNLSSSKNDDQFADNMHWLHPYIKNYIGEPDKFPLDLYCDDSEYPVFYMGRGMSGPDGFSIPHYINIIGQLFTYLPSELGNQYATDYSKTYRLSDFCSETGILSCADVYGLTHFQVNDPFLNTSDWKSGDIGGRLGDYAPGGSKFVKVEGNPEIDFTNMFIREGYYDYYSPDWPYFHPDFGMDFKWPAELWGQEWPSESNRRLDESVSTEMTEHDIAELESQIASGKSFFHNSGGFNASGRSLSEEDKPCETDENIEARKEALRKHILKEYNNQLRDLGSGGYGLGLDDSDEVSSEQIRRLLDSSKAESEGIATLIAKKARQEAADIADTAFGTGNTWKDKAKEYEAQSRQSRTVKADTNFDCEIGWAPSNITGNCYNASNRYRVQSTDIAFGNYATNDDVRMYDGGRHELNTDFYTRGNKTYSAVGARSRPLKSGSPTGFMPPANFPYKQWVPSMMIPDMAWDQTVLGRFMYPTNASAYEDTTNNLTLPPPVHTFETSMENHFSHRFILPDKALFEDIDLDYSPDFSKMKRVISPYAKLSDQSLPPCDYGLFVREAESKISSEDLTKYSWEVYSQAIGGRCSIDNDPDQKGFIPLYWGAVNVWSAGDKHTLKIAVRDSGREQPVYSKTVRTEKIAAEKKRSTPLTSIGGNGFNYYKIKHNLGEHYKKFYGRSREDGYSQEGFHYNKLFQNVADIDADFDGSRVRGKAGRQYIKSMDRFMQRYYSPNAYDTWFETSEQSPSYRIDDEELTEFRVRRQNRLADRRKFTGRNRLVRSQKHTAKRYKKDYKKGLPCAYCPSLAPTISSRYDSKKTIGW